MAKLLKQLGIGGKKTPNSPKLDCDPQRLDRKKPFQMVDEAAGSNLATGSDTASSTSTTGSDDLPPPPGALTLQNALRDIQSSGGASQAIGGARPKDTKVHGRQLGNEADKHMRKLTTSPDTVESDSDVFETSKEMAKKPKEFYKPSNIYENQEIVDALQYRIQDSGEVTLSNGSSLSDKIVSRNLPIPHDVRNRLGPNVHVKPQGKVYVDAAGKVLSPLGVVQRATRPGKNEKEADQKKQMESEYEKANRVTREPDYERYTQLKEELKLQVDEILEQERLRKEDNLDHLKNENNVMTRSDGYEEPWDLEVAQGEIEDQFNGVLVGEWILRERPTDDKVSPTNPQAQTSSAPSAELPSSSDIPNTVPPHELDVRTQRGYEKPWDWKPHMRDGRGPEGYEKPWDWKPHMKDDRPKKEYEEPWDKKGKSVENEVIVAKIAKEAAKVQQGRTTEDVRGKPHMKDGRPPTEYEEPWDTKAKDIETELIAAKIAKEAAKASVGDGDADAGGSSSATDRMDVLLIPTPSENERIGARRHLKDSRVENLKKNNQITRTASEDGGGGGGKGIRSPQAMLSPASRHHRLSSKKNLGLTPDLESSSKHHRIGERIQTKIPLVEQRWYHGTISRVDAESKLQGHKEGSYLVRHSESGTDEFSLSVKSSRGFMHMKIVVDRDSKYILGQFSQPFVSIPQMIQYYTVSKLPIKGAEHISLLYPINSSGLL